MAFTQTTQTRIAFTTPDGNSSISAQQAPDGTWSASLSVSLAGSPYVTAALAQLNAAVAALPAAIAADPEAGPAMAAMAAADAAAQAAAAAKGG